MIRSACLTASLLAAIAIAAAAKADPQKPAYGAWGYDLTAIDKGVKPGDQFFEYANGAWYRTAEIPADRSSIGSWTWLRILSESRMKGIMAELDARPRDQLSDEERKLRDLYDGFEDASQIESRGVAPAKKDLARLQSLKTLNDVATAMGDPLLQLSGPFGANIQLDDKNPNQYAIDILQSGLGLPDREYYIRKGDKNLDTTRAAYKKSMAHMFALAGYTKPAARAEAVYALEARLAQAHWSIAESRDPIKIYNPMTVSQLAAFAPQFPWKAWVSTLDIPLQSPRGERVLIVQQKSAFPKLAAIFAKTPVQVWRDYLTVHYLYNFGAYLPKAFDDESFQLNGAILAGRKQQLDRPTRGVQLLDGLMGEALGKIYVAKYFPPETKTHAQELVSNLLAAYEADLQTLPWMTPATRQKALEKLHKFTPHIGYPDKWRDYSAYVVTRDNLLGDVQRGGAFEWERKAKRIDQPTDKGEWQITPPTINAYYEPTYNEIVFPAAVLQPPFFDPNADDAVNYGAIGAVIGHEISHGFDDQGAKYDGDGVLRNWWTDEDLKNFQTRTAALAAQYDAYQPLPGLNVNGKQTLGENIGDLAGLTIALKAYHLSLKGNPASVLDGLTGDQRFFLGFAQIYRMKRTDAIQRLIILSDVHTPDNFRPIGATRNVDEWYNAFDVQPGQRYFLPPEQRVHLW